MHPIANKSFFEKLEKELLNYPKYRVELLEQRIMDQFKERMHTENRYKERIEMEY